MSVFLSATYIYMGAVMAMIVW